MTTISLSRAQPRRSNATLVVVLGAVTSLGLVVASRSTGSPPADSLPATSPGALLAMAVTGWVLVRAIHRLGAGWTALRLVLTGLTAVAVLYPGVWAAAALASSHAPHTRFAWLLAVLAGVAHLPVIGAFSLLPLVAVRYLGTGSGRASLLVVTALGAAAAVLFALFFDDYAPLAASAPLSSASGERVGMLVTLAFLATVFVGPVAALLAIWRTTSDGGAARRLALVAGSSLTGTGLVMLCGLAVGTGSLGGSLLLAGMYAALAVVVTGCTAALATDRSLAEDLRTPEMVTGTPDLSPPQPPAVEGLTSRETEVLTLLAEGLSNAGIAARLVVSERTVDAHLRSVFAKLDLPQSREHNRRVHAVNAWRQVAPQSRGTRSGAEHRS